MQHTVVRFPQLHKVRTSYSNYTHMHTCIEVLHSIPYTHIPQLPARFRPLYAHQCMHSCMYMYVCTHTSTPPSKPRSLSSHSPEGYRVSHPAHTHETEEGPADCPARYSISSPLPSQASPGPAQGQPVTVPNDISRPLRGV